MTQPSNEPQPPPAPAQPGPSQAAQPPPAQAGPPAYPPAPQGYAYGSAPTPPDAIPPYAAPPKQSSLAEGAEYHLALTGPGWRWWRPLLNFGVMIVLLCSAVGIFSVVVAVGMLVKSGGDADALNELEDLKLDDPFLFGSQNLMLASLILLVLAATWIAHQVRPGFASSVIGRFRWGWAGWCTLVLLPMWGVYLVVASIFLTDTAAGGGAGDNPHRPEHWILLLVLMVLTTPLQAAGEEYLFRGWIMQLAGSVIRHRWVSLAVAAFISAGLFALAHGSFDIWIFLDLMGMAVGMVVLTWRTGGLEAAVVLHAINNLVAIGYAILFGNLAESFISTDTTSDPVSTLISWVAIAVATAVLWWLARRRGIARTVPVQERTAA